MNPSILDTTMAEHGTPVRFQAGETLFHEGDHPRGVYVLQSGTVKLLFTGKSGVSKALREAQAGQILGLSSLVALRDHDCTATAAEPCEVCFIGKDDFLHVLDDSPAVWFNVLHDLSTEVNAAYDDIRVMSRK